MTVKLRGGDLTVNVTPERVLLTDLPLLADIALFGHTHRPCVEWVGGVLLINPGALMRGRYAELLLDGKRIIPTLKKL